MRKLIIIGAGGHARVVAEIARLNGYKSVDFLADSATGDVIGKTCEFIKYIDEADFVVAIGNAAVRQKFQMQLKENNASIISLIHPNATISEDTKIGLGTVVMAGAIVNPNVQIGNGVILNTNSSVDHDCRVGDFAHVSIGAKLCGTVDIGEKTWIGAGATVINNLSICSDCMIGAGATVVKNIDCPGIYIGTPARKK